MTDAVSATPRRQTARASTLRATLLVVFSACCFGSIGPLTVIALQHGAQLPAVQTWRYGVAALLLLAYARVTQHGRAVRDRGVRPWYHPVTLLIAGGGQATVATMALLALRWIPAATQAFLFYTYPVLVTIIAAVRGVEPLTRVRVLALLLAVGGIVAMVGAPDAGTLHPAGVGLALAAALIYALYIPVLAGLQARRSPIDVACAMSVGGSIGFAIWALTTGALPDALHPTAFAASILQGVLTTAAFVGFLAGLAELGAVRTAITCTVEPFWTTMLGVVLLAQPAGAGTTIGGICIMAAVLLLQRVAVRPPHSSTLHEDGPSGRPSP